MHERLKPIALAFGSASLAFAAVLIVTPPTAHAGIGQSIRSLGTGSIPLVMGMVLVFAALVLEWQGIVRAATIENKTLFSIEAYHPRFVSGREMTIVVLLSATIGIFITQLAFNMYASSYIPATPVLTDYVATDTQATSQSGG